MEMEELTHADPSGDDDGPGLRLYLILIGIVVVVGIVVMIIRSNGVRPPGSSPAPTPSAASAGPEQAFVTPAPNEQKFIGVSKVCPPVTDHRTRLTLSFEVSNVSSDTVDITGVSAVLPVKGLSQVGQATAGGSCAKPASDGALGLLGSQASQLITLVLAVPKTCPAADPVQVRIDFSASGFFESSLNVLEPDLTGVTFANCPVASP